MSEELTECGAGPSLLIAMAKWLLRWRLSPPQESC
jgi:hypothetical protein